MPDGPPLTFIDGPAVRRRPSNSKRPDLPFDGALCQDHARVGAPGDALTPAADLRFGDERERRLVHGVHAQPADVVEEGGGLRRVRAVHDRHRDVASVGRDREPLGNGPDGEMIDRARRRHRQVDHAQRVGSTRGADADAGDDRCVAGGGDVDTVGLEVRAEVLPGVLDARAVDRQDRHHAVEVSRDERQPAIAGEDDAAQQALRRTYLDGSGGRHRLARDCEHGDCSGEPVGDERERARTVDRHAGGPVTRAKRRQHSRWRRLQIDNGQLVIGHRLRPVRRVDPRRRGDEREGLVGRDRPRSGAGRRSSSGPATPRRFAAVPWPRSMMVTVSGGGLGTVVLTPSTSRTLASLAETTIWASVSAQRMHNSARNDGT